MRKAIVLFFILLVGLPTLTQAQSAKDALMGLKKLQARTQTGISYMDYSNAVGEAKFPLNVFIESKDAQKYPELSLRLLTAMAHYEFAVSVWGRGIRNRNMVEANTVLGPKIKELYPNTPTIGKSYYVPELLQDIWGEASIELDKATKLYSKLEEKPSDETAKLKKEIAELKKEVTRLKTENDLLKELQGGKKGR